MSFIGSAAGPRTSKILRELGPERLGVTAEGFESAISLHESQERDGCVEPVYVDSEERRFIVLTAPGGGTQRYYLEENGCGLEGAVEQRKMEDADSVLRLAEEEIAGYLDSALRADRIDKQSYEEAKSQTFPTLVKWMGDQDIDRISPHLKEGLRDAIVQRRLEDIVNAFRQPVRFGTGGIRGMMAFDRESIVRLKEQGVAAPILKGPNTINDLVLLATSAGVAQFGKDQDPPLEKVVVGYDSRIRGHDLGVLVARLFLAYDYTVYFFDAPCPYPEVTYAIPDEAVKADVGILISASHNDYRYNGYKLSCANGSQFDPEERDEMYRKYISNVKFSQIRLRSFADVPQGKLVFLGGSEPLAGYDYAGRQDCRIDMHTRHCNHVKSFLLTPDLAQRQQASDSPLHIGYCAFHGVGRIAVPRLLREVGFTEIKPITVNGLNDLNGLFPSFCSDPGREQQPDPGDPRAADTAVAAFKQEYPGEFENMDILIGTDPDADRCGVVVKVPEDQRHLHDGKDYLLLPADDAWALVLWYRIQRDIERNGQVTDAEKKFIVQSHTTSDSIVRLARKHGLGVVKTWVGFAALAAATRDVWEGKVQEILPLAEGRTKEDPDRLCHMFVCSCEGMANGKRSVNVGAMEQSNGFSILGGPPPDRRSLGEGGHVRDKDGTFAALLVAEISAWAKERGTSLLELLDEHIYLDPDIGLFANLYEPDPMDGEYPGIEGDRLKKAILRRALGNFQLALSGDLEIGGRKVVSACIYRTGKYDEIYPPTYDFLFPDEGVRFFFDEEGIQHVTVRPSGTGNSLRFHVQLHAMPKGPDEAARKRDLIEQKERLQREGMAIMDGIRSLLKAPRAT